MGYSLRALEPYPRSYPTVCAVAYCRKPLPPPYKRPFWLRGSDLCARHASFQKRIDEEAPGAQLYLERWSERERDAASVTYEPEFIYVKDSSVGSTRKFRASFLKAADAPERSRKS